MKTIPMIFNTEMVKAILDGRKTVTRRPANVTYERGMKGPVIKKGDTVSTIGFTPVAGLCPFGNVGDLVYVRETFATLNAGSCEQEKPNKHMRDGQEVRYRASDRLANEEDWEVRGYRWVPSIHMPRWASRITLKVTNVRIERVQSLKPSDATLEGFNDWTGFAFAWTSIYGKRGLGWDENPYVWVIEFEIINQNVDSYLMKAA